MTAATKTQPAKPASTNPEKAEPPKPQPKTLKEAAALGVVKLVRKRKNGTLRQLPYLAPGSDPRKAAEAVAARRAKGETINAVAEDTKAPIATVRRMVTNSLRRSKPARTPTSRAWATRRSSSVWSRANCPDAIVRSTGLA